MFRTFRSVRFLVKAPLIAVMLIAINLFTSPTHWWAQWPILFLAIAWCFALIRVATTVAMLGGVAALAAYFSRPR